MAIIASFTNISSSYITTQYTSFVRENDKLFCWTIISVERQPTKQFQHLRKGVQKTLSKAPQKEESENPCGQHFEQPLWRLTKSNTPESSLKDAFSSLSSHKRMSRQQKKMCKVWHLYGQLLVDQETMSNELIKCSHILFQYENHDQEDVDMRTL